MKVFIDSSVIIAGLLSRQGGSGQILELCEAKIIEGIVSVAVIQEVNEVISRKFPEIGSYFKTLLKITHLKTIKTIAPSLLRRATSWISHPKDAAILAAAKHAKVDFLVTLDLRHFIKDPDVTKKSGVKIYTPGEFLHIFRTSKISP